MAAKEEISLAADDLRNAYPDLGNVVSTAERELLDDLIAAEHDDPDLYGNKLHLHRTQGFVRVAFRLAFWELLHAPSYEAALIDVANRGGDADTNGAITGALLGATHGEDGIPERWRQTVLEVLQDAPSSPWKDAYHPRRLIALADSVRDDRQDP